MKRHKRAKKFFFIALGFYLEAALLVAVTWFASQCVGGDYVGCAGVLFPFFAVFALVGTAFLIVALVNALGGGATSMPPDDTGEYEEKFYGHH